MDGPKRGRRKTNSKANPRRSHKLGGCLTCRRRHVKCDQARPICERCRNARIDCVGYPPQIRWASVSHSAAPPIGRREVPQSFGKDSSANSSNSDSEALVQGPTAQTERAATAQTPFSHKQHEDIVPLGHDHHDASLNCNLLSIPLTTQDLLAETLTDNDARTNQSMSSLSESDFFFDSSGSLGWTDLFDNAFEFPSADPQEEICGNFLDSVAGATDLSLYTVAPSQDVRPPPYMQQQVTEIDVIEDARQFLKHFRDAVIPQFGPGPMFSKSPWESINWAAAVQTLADLTYLQTQKINHACKANLFAIIACAAHHSSVTQPNSDPLLSERTAQILDVASKRAKYYLQASLRFETCGRQKAKYKEQLMAIFGLISHAALTGNEKDARCYMIDAERLLRLRGLAKREVSRRARLLHHIYTWLRIIGESTFTIQSHDEPQLEVIIESSMRGRRNMDSGDVEKLGRNVQLDDFLRIERCGSDDDSGEGTSKEQDVGLRDIHLEDLRPWPRTLLLEIYGIPEIWLSLVSQTTRVANVMDYIRRNPKYATSDFAKRMEKRIDRLDSMICAFAAQRNESKIALSSSALSSSNSDEDRDQASTSKTTPMESMLSALSSALVILFYRRLRQVHPWILQGHVSNVIAALQEFDVAQEGSTQKHPGTPWPAFIAGCEAMSPRDRQWIINWMQKGSRRAAAYYFASSQQVMREVWRQNDVAREMIDQQIGGSRGEYQQSRERQKPMGCSWVDVLRANNTWLMLF